jgi:chromosomal replication initiation ATPase DnaA
MRPPDRRQLGLPLAPPPALGRADFLPAAPNSLALALISSPEGLPGGRLVIHGPEGAGKTHLAAIWAAESGARWLDPGTLPAALPALLADGGPANLVLDDAARLAGMPGEEALFHLLNHLATTGGAILMTARAPARDWGLSLPDLASRLTAAAHVALGLPDDTLLVALLVKLFADRQTEVSADLVLWLARRIERSFATAQAVVAALDAEALRLRQPVTRPLAQRVLAGSAGFGDGEGLSSS